MNLCSCGSARLDANIIDYVDYFDLCDFCKVSYDIIIGTKKSEPWNFGEFWKDEE